MTARPMEEGERIDALAVATRIARAADIVSAGLADGPVDTDERHAALSRYAAASRTVGETGVDGVFRARALLSLSAEVKGLREALEPFANIADWYHNSEDGSHEIWVDAHERATRVTVGMCKAARAALSPIPTQGDEQARPSASAPASTRKTWKQTVADERKRLGRDMTLEELIDLARPYRMTDAEIEAQRQSWTRQDMD